VSVPLSLDFAFLQQALLTQMFTGPEQTVRVWDDGSGCNFLILSDPRVDARHEKLRITAAGVGRVGTAVGESCLTLLDWKGTVEALEEPTVDAAQPIVRFRVVDSHLFGSDGRKQVAGTLWDWIKSYVHPRLEAVSVDLHQPLDELRAFLPLVLPADDGAQTAALLDSIALADPRFGARGLSVDLRFEAPDAPTPAVDAAVTPSPEPALSEAEIAAWQTAWQQWDAFLTLVAKQAASDDAAQAQRLALFDVLIAARYDILWVLRPSAPSEPDPVPALFAKTWTRLSPVLRTLSLGLPGEGALRYLSFIAAADALQALEQLGPGTGIDLSADGLRRWARMIVPTAGEDALDYSEAIDPTLRALFGFGEPLPPPAENPDVDLSWWRPAAAWAAGDLTARLNKWVPTRQEVPEYLPLVHELLTETATQTLQKHPLDPQFHQLYRWLLPATAWKESCWRQFVRAGGTLKPMRSPVGAIGIMQVNPKVWRGFYDVKGLGQDIGYNAMAGAEILLRYLRDYAIAKGEHTATGSLDNLARAAYAVYNGGPGHLRRYRKAKTSRSLRKIDESFLDKYRKIKAGNALAVAECFGP